VLCDVYASHFEPMSTKLNPILFPLAGTPVLAYTLEFLERGGVEDIILVCSMLSSQVQKYIEGSRWGEPRYPVKVKVVSLATASSTGEALREIDRLGLVKSDFVLVRGGVLSNLPLPSIVEEHRKRRDENPEKMLMTMVTMQTDTQSAFDIKR
jgi:translation initiation factor eIF-2B subunit epsilon